MNSSGNDRYAGDIENGNSNLVFNKQGGGTFTFAGEGTYTGATSVDGGTYRLEGSITSSAITVKSGAIFEGVGGVIGNSLAMNNGSAMLFTLSGDITEPLLTLESLNLSSNVDLKLVLNGIIAAGTEIQLLDLGNEVNRSFATINGEQLPLDGLISLTYGAQEYFFQYHESAMGISVIAIPEPQSVAMMLLGAGAVLGACWTRRRFRT